MWTDEKRTDGEREKKQKQNRPFLFLRPKGEVYEYLSY